MRFIKGACSTFDKSSRYQLCYRRDVCKDFYRNAINIGLPIIECKEAAQAIKAGDEVEVDFDSGVITDITTGEKYKGQAFPPFMQKIIDCEGLVNYINQK